MHQSDASNEDSSNAGPFLSVSDPNEDGSMSNEDNASAPDQLSSQRYTGPSQQR